MPQQQILAFLIIIFFVSRLFWQKKNGNLAGAEFVFWLVFWASTGIVILFLKKIDAIVAELGFSSQGINILVYLAIALLFYFIFRVRLRLERIERNITELTREISYKNVKK